MTDGVEKKTYSAKQVASRIGTDAKQLRKFLRDPNSGYKPVGQGGRYDFPEADLPAIKTAFDAWDATKIRRNRTSAEKKPTATGMIPGQRKTSPGTDTPPRPRRQTPEALFKQGMHGNALDTDNFSARTQGIGARVKKHGLIPNQQGRLVEEPEHIKKAREAAELLPRYPEIDTIPGLNKPQPVELDFSDPEVEAPSPEAWMRMLTEEVGKDDEEIDFDELDD